MRLTDKQQKIYDYIGQQIACGHHPTVRDIMHKFGMKSPNGAQTHLKWMKKKGVVYRDATGKLQTA